MIPMRGIFVTCCAWTSEREARSKEHRARKIASARIAQFEFRIAHSKQIEHKLGGTEARLFCLRSSVLLAQSLFGLLLLLTSAIQNPKPTLFNNPIRPCQDVRRNGDADLFCCIQIDHHFKFGRLLDRNVGGSGAL
jgi:hypothetical protein